MRTGSHHNSEAIKKLRAARARQIFTDETILKRSLALKGRLPWNKGLTKETDSRLALLSQKTKGIPHYPRTPEQIDRFRKTIQKQGHWAKGQTKETHPGLAAHSKKTIGRDFAEEKYGKEKATELKRKAGLLGAIAQENKYDEKELLELRKDWGMKGLIACELKPNRCELYILALLEALYSGEWKYVGDGEVKIGKKNPDFININGKKAVIEFFGEHWHTRKEEEQERTNHYLEYGFNALVIWESELKNKEAVIIKIKEFIEKIAWEKDMAWEKMILIGGSK